MNEVPMDRVGIDGVNGLIPEPASAPAERTRKRGFVFRKTRRPGGGGSRDYSSSISLPDMSAMRESSNKGSGNFTHKTSDSFRVSHKTTLDRIYRHVDQQDVALGNGKPFTAADEGAIALLREQGFSTGLAIALHTNAMMFHSRIWIVDNSGSMEIGDGHRIVLTSDRKTVAQDVSRWEELQDTVAYHAEMAALLHSPTWFKLLNHPGPGFQQQDFRVGGPGSNADADIRNGRTFMQRVKPIGTTPLVAHVWSIQKHVHYIAPQLRRDGKRVVVVLATDGLPTDSDGYIGDDVDAEFFDALKALEGLPVWLVIRLCTDEDKVTKFYNELDQKLDLSLEVLDDFFGEAKEVRRHNKWLNYCLPMHRCRELGYHNRVFDFLDERPLTKGELRDFCCVLFGTRFENIPDPTIAWKDFLKYVQEKLVMEDLQFDPLAKKKAPWINVRALHRTYGNGKCTVS